MKIASLRFDDDEEGGLIGVSIIGVWLKKKMVKNIFIFERTMTYVKIGNKRSGKLKYYGSE